MTLVIRERRQQQALRLSLPQRTVAPPPPLAPPPPTKDLEKIAVLGHGNGGTVYKVRHKKSDCFYALKVIRFNPDSNNNIGTVHQQQPAAVEADIVKRLDSPYVVKCDAVYEGACSGDVNDGLSFVMEYMGGGSLHDILKRHHALPERVIADVARRVLEGLNYLHGMHIVHRDIKPSNLLVNDAGEVKIADFGVSHVVEEGTVPRDRYSAGTWAYMSPERIDPENWGGQSADEYAGDVWSLGVVVLECLMGRFPLIPIGKRPDWAALMCAICFGEKVEVPEDASAEFRSFVGRCMEKDWRKRGTVRELLAHPFLNRECCCGGYGGKGLCDYVLHEKD